MATSLDSISGIGANARKLAKLLQAKAPEGHMLAYINPREAALLKANGGSGEPDPETGIPSFEDEGTPFNDYEYGPAPTATPYAVGGFEQEPTPEPITAAPEFDYSRDRIQPASYSSGSSGIDTQLSSFPQAREIPAFDTSRPSVDPETQRLMGQEPEKAAPKGGISEDTLKRLGIAGAMGLLGGRTARAAARAGQGGKAEMQALAAPYQQKGQELQAQAQRGELTPQAMQSLQAAQAQAAQGAERRGGVGAAQAQMQIEQLRQQLLQQQYDYGLKLSGIGDNIALGAIKTGLEADRYVQGVNNSFYQNMAYIAAGMTPGGRP
jgi:hypothetical protein